MIHSRIIGTGSYLPEKVVTNSDLARTVDTSDEWVRTRTGIQSRHVAAEGQLASDLALPAAKRAMKAAGVEAGDIDLLIVATTTPDMIFPSTACILQSKLGIAGCPAFDVQAVCSGFVYALTIADLFIRAGQARHVLIVGTEVYSRILDWNDRGTCVLFGDSVRPIVRNLLKHLCSAISYGGARSLAELQERFRSDPARYVIRLTESARRESFDR
jgi:3-oxoacyl-[acyl-carrier-protein] synthase-3